MNTPDSLTIVRVIARLNVGGPARQALLLHGGLRPRGFRTILVHGTVGADEASLEHLLAERGLEATKLPDLGRRIRPLGDLHGFLQLLRLVFREKPDIVHTHTAKAGALGRLAVLTYNATRRRRSRCLAVHTYHGNVLQGYFGPAGSLAVRLIERALARVTHRVVTISPSQRREIVDRFRIAPDARVSVVRLGLDLDAFFEIHGTDRAARVGLGLPAESIVFASVGRLAPIKDLGTLLRATAIARQTEPAIRLVIVGDGGERAPLVALADQLHLGDAVRFVGWQYDLPHLYAGVDAVALSSRNEGTPVTLIEAMASARPVVATAVGGVPDVVIDGETGLLAPPGDPAALARQMVRLSRSADDREGMGAAGRRAACSYRQEYLLEALSQLYRRDVAALRT